MERFHFTFEQHGEGAAPALYGQVRVVNPPFSRGSAKAPVYFFRGRWHRRREVKRGWSVVLQDVSPALQERLGREGTLGLLSLLDAARLEWGAEMTHHTLERFERRLTEEAAGLKTMIGLSEGSVRLEIKQGVSQLRTELDAGLSDLRVEFNQGLSDVRVELKGDISRLDASVKESLLNQTRWMFGMWVGQVAATAAIIAGMFRVFTQ